MARRHLRGLLNHIELAEGDLLVVLNQTIDLLQQVQGAVGQALDARGLWQTKGSTRRPSRAQHDMRLRLEDLRGSLAEGWRHMLRGSVALSRAIPSMTVSAEAPADEDELPAIPMAEDEDTGDVWDDRAGDTIIGEGWDGMGGMGGCDVDGDVDGDDDSAIPTDGKPPRP